MATDNFINECNISYDANNAITKLEAMAVDPNMEEYVRRNARDSIVGIRNRTDRVLARIDATPISIAANDAVIRKAEG